MDRLELDGLALALYKIRINKVEISGAFELQETMSETFIRSFHIYTCL
jgi:hypothetical protein